MRMDTNYFAIGKEFVREVCARTSEPQPVILTVMGGVWWRAESFSRGPQSNQLWATLRNDGKPRNVTLTYDYRNNKVELRLSMDTVHIFDSKTPTADIDAVFRSL
jgi:hypothetical protein